MKYVRMPVILTLTGPILTQSTAPGEAGIDSPVARNDKGDVMLPFSLVKGRVRQSWCELSDRNDDVAWFGGAADTDFVPNRARFRFSDFVAREGDRHGVKHRIRIDRRTGTADDGALQFIESPFAAGEPVEFRGEVSWFAEDALAEARRLEEAFRWTNNFGAERTTGFGRVANVVVEQPMEQTLSAAQAAVETVPPILGLQLEMLEPFCIARRQAAKNLFESEDVISGAVIRGVLATIFNQSLGKRGTEAIEESVDAWPMLGKWFNTVRFTPALPVANTASNSPVVLPLSLVQDQKDEWHDVALCAVPIVFSFEADGKPQFRAPRFVIDWKDQQRDAVEAAFGWNWPRRELRVRTAIDSTTRRAKDEQLFAYEMVIPAGFRWQGSVDLSNVAESDRPQLLAQLNSLLSIGGTDGIQGFGKSKARARVTVGEEIPPIQASTLAPIDKSLWIITLQSPALLCDPKEFDESTNARQLHDAYAAVFDELSGQKLQLVRYFAQQSLAGGEYLHTRFRKHEPYAPFLLTDRGSVFVLRQTGDAAELVTRWLRNGLPLPKWAIDHYGVDWRTNPFLPVDGFATIAVNLPCHTKNAPQPGTFVEVSAAKGGV
jgi:CRISPR/Cas system CSM-associated protein Csm3 (group 7 of RAMP superfamily)